MASAQPTPAQPAGTATPPTLRLLERVQPPAHRSLPPAPTWSARLGRWVDRLLVS